MHRDLLIHPVSSPDSPPLFSPLSEPPRGIKERCRELPQICSPGHYCLPSKPVLLIFVWSAVVGAVYAAVFDTVIGLGVSFQHSDKEHVLIWLIIGPYAVLAVVQFLYPLSGFLADVCCGRFRTITISLFLFWCAFIPLCVIAVMAFVDNSQDLNTVYILLGVSAFILFTVALSGYQANIIQLGLDQLLEVPCRYLGLFVHWNGWSGSMGAVFCHILAITLACHSNKEGVPVKVVKALPLLILLMLSVLLAFSCYNHRWFYSEPGQHNPYKTVLKVLSFAKKHKRPLQRSALTYCEDEKPSRIDFAKRKYGGPFETDQVEDVKTFLRILCLLVCLGPVFVLDVPASSFVFIVFGLHISIGKQMEFRHSDKCQSLPRWLLLESGGLKEIFAVMALPVYIWVVYSLLHRKVPRILTRLKIAVVLFLVGVLSMLAIDLAGHIASAHHTSTNSSESIEQCMFTVRNKLFDFAPLNMSHWVLILPNVILGIAPLLVNVTVFEFISAQSPHSMKGLLVGMFFAIQGFFHLIGAVSLFPFTMSSLWDTEKMRATRHVTNCGFGYFLLTSAVATVGVVVFLAAARRYQYRQRDEAPYDHRYVETYYKRYTRKIHTQQSPEEEGILVQRGLTAAGGEGASCTDYGAAAASVASREAQPVATAGGGGEPSLSLEWSW